MDESTGRFRRAVRQDVPAIVRLLADDPLGSTRETANGDQFPDAYWRAFQAIDADPHQLLVVADIQGQVVGTLQLTFIPSLTYTGGERAQIERVRVAPSRRGRGLGREMVLWQLSAHVLVVAAWCSSPPTNGDLRQCASMSRWASAQPTSG